MADIDVDWQVWEIIEPEKWAEAMERFDYPVKAWATVVYTGTQADCERHTQRSNAGAFENAIPARYETLPFGEMPSPERGTRPSLNDGYRPSTDLADGFRQYARNGRAGTCVDCPRTDGRAYPEFCEHFERFDHQMGLDRLVQVDTWERKNSVVPPMLVVERQG